MHGHIAAGAGKGCKLGVYHDQMQVNKMVLMVSFMDKATRSESQV